MSEERDPPSNPRPAGVPVRTLVIGAAFVVALAAIAWGYLGGETKRNAPPAPIVAVPSAAPVSAPASAPAPVAAAPAAPASAPASASTPTPTFTPSADVAAVLPAGTATPRPDATAVRGVIKPKDEVLFSAKIAGRIAQMPYREGERFQKGVVLVAFDCTRIRAEANAAWAANRASNQVLRQSQELDKYNAIGKTDVQIAKAKAEQSGAEAGALEAQMRDCTITAPFSGIVVENISHLHENAAAGKELTRVLNDSELEMHLIAPSAWLSWLQPGSPFRFRIDETARSYEGKVARLGASVDPVSQTVRVVGVFTGNRDNVLPGMSGSAEFPQNPALQSNANANANAQGKP